MDESLRKLEPTILRFEKEGQAVLNLSLNLSHTEKLDFLRRIQMAKEMILFYKIDLQNKLTFFDEVSKRKFISPKFKVFFKLIFNILDRLC